MIFPMNLYLHDLKLLDDDNLLSYDDDGDENDECDDVVRLTVTVHSDM